MSTDLDTARYNYQNFRYCYDNGHREWLVKAYRCMEFWKGNQWSDYDLQKLKKAGRPALTFNVIESLVRAMQGTQRSLRNDVRFAPVSDASADSAQAQDATWLHIQNQNSLEFLESELYVRGLITGRAFYDVRVDFDEQLQGQVQISTERGQDVVLDPGFEYYDPHSWPQVIKSRWSNLLDVEHQFGKEKAEQLKHSCMPEFYDLEDVALARQLGKMPYYISGLSDTSIDSKLIRALRLVDRQFFVLKTKDVFVDTTTGDTSEIPESWDRARISHVLEQTPGLGTMPRRVKTVHWTVSCEDVTLHDEDSPYKDFTTVPFFPTMLDGVTMGAVEGLLDPAMLYNKVTSQELHIINTTANSGWKSKVNNIKNHTAQDMETIGSRTGLYLEVEDVTQTVKIEPNQVPAAHDRLSQKADTIMRSLSGVSQQSRGFAREDVAGEAILMNQAAADVNFAGPLANLHHSKRILATRVLDCVQAYYTETRILMINRGSIYRPDFQNVTINQITPEGGVVNDVTKGKYTTVLVPSPARTTMTESEFDQMLELRKLGIQIPDAMLIELSSAPNKGQLIQQLKGDSNDAAQKQQAMQEQIQSLELELTQAKTDREKSVADLNTARAQKATVESQTDPDAAYERVENNRISTDAQLERERLAVEQQGLGLKRRTADHNTALELTKIDAENARHGQKILADVAKAAKPAPSKKPGVTP